MSSGHPSSSVHPANNSGLQCKWITGGVPCNQDTADFDDLMVHLRDVHGVRGSAAGRLTCQWSADEGACSKECRRPSMRRHIAVHLDFSVPCPECGKPYSRPDSMRAHAKREHGKE